MLASYFNPYSNTTYLTFFQRCIERLILFFQGSLGFSDLVSDEIQMIVLIGISISTSLVGVFLVLRGMTMLANSLSHTILLGIVILFFIQDQTLGLMSLFSLITASCAMGILTTFFTQFLTEKLELQEDASTGIVFTSLFALAIVLVTLFTRNAHIGAEIVMGNIDAVHQEDLMLPWAMVFFNGGLFYLFFKEFQMTTFDRFLSKTMGISPLFFNYLLMVQVAGTSIGAFRSVGVLLVLAFMSGPVLIARLFTNRLKSWIFLSIVLSCFLSISGVALSRHLLTMYDIPLSTGGIVVCLITVCYVFSLLIYFISEQLIRRKFLYTQE